MEEILRHLGPEYFTSWGLGSVWWNFVVFATISQKVLLLLLQLTSTYPKTKSSLPPPVQSIDYPESYLLPLLPALPLASPKLLYRQKKFQVDSRERFYNMLSLGFPKNMAVQNYN